MSEILWATVIGGSISIVATIPSLIVNYYHWKKDKKLEYLKGERRLREEQYLNIFSNLDPHIKEDNQSKDIKTRVGLFLPDEIHEQIYAFFNEEDVVRREVIRCAIASLMKKSLDEINKEIKGLMS